LELLDSIEAKLNRMAKGLHAPKQSILNLATKDIEELRRELSRGWLARLVGWWK